MVQDAKLAFWEALISSAETANTEGDFEQAETLFRRAISVAEENFGNKHINVGHSLLYFGDFLEQQKRYVEGESAYKGAIQIYQISEADDLLAMALRNLAQVQWRQKHKSGCR